MHSFRYVTQGIEHPLLSIHCLQIQYTHLVLFQPLIFYKTYIVLFFKHFGLSIFKLERFHIYKYFYSFFIIEFVFPHVESQRNITSNFNAMSAINNVQPPINSINPTLKELRLKRKGSTSCFGLWARQQCAIQDA